MMRNPRAIWLQASGLLGAIGLATLAPQPGRASLLVPMPSLSSEPTYSRAARWAASEDARLVAMASNSGRVTVIAPSGSSLARALLWGLVPISSEIPACLPRSNQRED